MPRDMRGTGRYAPQPRYHPFSFYSAVRLGDPEMLAKIMQVDPYFLTQDNGAGAPIHFAVTYRQLDMVHHLLNCGAAVNQRDPRGFTPLHRSAYLAHMDGYLEIYEYLLSRGADPSIRTEDYDPYLDPGPKTPLDVAAPDPRVRAALEALHDKYGSTPKAPLPHPDLGDWWALYDYGPDVVAAWPADYRHPYPEEAARGARKAEVDAARRLKREKRQAFLASLAAGGDGSEVLAQYAQQEEGQGAQRQVAVAAASGPSASGGAAAGFDPASSPIAFLFPGQGSQALGMLSAAAALPAVQSMLATAQAVLGYDLLEVCRTGPKERLDDTRVSQPALFVAGLAAVELLRAAEPDAVARCGAAAGLSLGEYTALVFGGALSFEDGLKVVKARGEAMAAAAAAPPGSGVRPHGMLSVVGLMDEQLEELAAQAAATAPPDTVCQLANYLFPQGRVVSGHLDALEGLQQAAMGAGAIKAQLLQVSGAFHTPLMAPARQALEQVLSSVELTAARIPVISNVTAQPFPQDPNAIRQLLARQLVEPVRWEASLSALLGSGKSRMYELGPGQQIKAMVKRLDMDVWRAFKNVVP